MPMSFCETTDGTVLMANGIDPVRAYRPDQDRVDPAGVEPAVGLMSLSFAGGRVSGTPYTDPVTGNLVTPSSGGGNISGTYRAFVRYVNERGEVGNPSAIAGPLTSGLVPSQPGYGYSAVRYENVPVPTEPSVKRKQILRNTNGQAAVFYVDIDTDRLDATVLESNLTDEELRDQPTQPMLDNPGRPLFNRFGRPPATAAFLTHHLGRVWGAGVEEYSEGSCRLTRNSTTVVGVGCRWRESMAGRFFHHQIGFASEIAVVPGNGDRSTEQTLILAQPWPYATQQFAVYAIRPEREADDSLLFSEPGLPEAWAGDNQLQAKRDGDPVTAMIPLRSFLYVARRRSMDRVTAQGDPRVDAYIFDSVARGCAGPRSFVLAEGVAFVLDERGVYKFDGTRAESVSLPIQDIFRGDNRQGYGINWSKARYFHTSYSQDEQVVRFFVTLRGGHVPRHALCLTTDEGKWWLEEYPVPVGGSALCPIGRRTGTTATPRRKLLLGGPGGRVMATAPGADLGLGRPSRVSAAGIDWISVRRPGPVQAGSPVAVARGRGAGQVRAACGPADADGRIRLDRPWSVVPAAGDRVLVGGIPYTYLTHRLEYTTSEDQDGFALDLQFEPVPGGQFRADLIPDFEAEPARLRASIGAADNDGRTADEGEPGVTIDTAVAQGSTVVRADRHAEPMANAERGAAVRLSGVSGDVAHRLYSLGVNGAEKGG